MPSDYSFRLSMYLSLALACGCLGYAEADLLPSGAVIAGLVVGLLAVAFRSEGRFELGLAAANRLGVVLFVGAGVWLASQFANADSLIRTVDWPASLLPYVGTMLLVAMPAKLLRPKHAGDWWALQGMGLAAVTLASALAEDGVFGVLLALYAVTAVAGLGLFYLKREAGQVPPTPRDPLLTGSVEWLLGRKLGGPPQAPPAVVASVPTRVRAAWRPAVGWLVVAVAVALPLFFLTPRTGGPRWTLGGTSLETGYDSPQMVDLNRTGELHVNTEPAFEVVVTDAAGRPFDGLSLVQRWRGAAYGQYSGGKWQGFAQARLIDPSALMSDQRSARSPPAVRTDMRTAVFTPRGKTLEPPSPPLLPPLADPVRWEAGVGSPVWATDRAGRSTPVTPWPLRTDASFAPNPVRSPGTRQGYIQFLYPPADGDPDLGTGIDPDPVAPTRQLHGAVGGGTLLAPDPLAGADPASSLRTLPNGLTELPRRTHQLLDELVARRSLSARVTRSAGFRRDTQVEPADWEAVAVAIRNHLVSGEYEYTLTLRRQDRKTDPIEDFLYRTKAGNCERFAAGLVLMCRAVGIPARYVLGFKGHEQLGDGRYLVRQYHAHAWVEVLVPRRAATPAGYRWHWLTLDPTPDGGDDAATDGSLLGSATRGGKSLFHDFIVGYNTERRRQAAAELEQAVTRPPFLRWLGGVVTTLAVVWIGWWLVRMVRRRVVPPPPAVGWFDRLVRTLTRAGHAVAVGQTPAEHARMIGDRLAADPRTVAVAGVPAELTARYYRQRFGGHEPTADDLARIEADLRRLKTALPPR